MRSEVHPSDRQAPFPFLISTVRPAETNTSSGADVTPFYAYLKHCTQQSFLRVSLQLHKWGRTRRGRRRGRASQARGSRRQRRL